MSKELYRYNRAGKLIQQPRMQKPNRDDFIRAVAQPFFEVDIIFDGVKFDKAEKKYLQHIESLRSYDTFHTEWGDGDLEEGKDFKISHYSNEDRIHRTEAVPIVQVDKQVE